MWVTGKSALAKILLALFGRHRAQCRLHLHTYRLDVSSEHGRNLARRSVGTKFRAGLTQFRPHLSDRLALRRVGLGAMLLYEIRE